MAAEAIQQTILRRAERMKRHYPRKPYTIAQLALCGDSRADQEFIEATYRRQPLWHRLRAAWRAFWHG